MKRAVEMFWFRKASFAHQLPGPFKAFQAVEGSLTGMTPKRCTWTWSNKDSTVLELQQPKWESQEKQLLAVTPQEALVRAEIVKVVFVLCLDMHLLCAEGSPGTRRGRAAKSWHVWVQEAEWPWRPALLRGVNPPCASQSQSCLCRIPGLGCAVPSQPICSLFRNTWAPFIAVLLF